MANRFSYSSGVGEAIEGIKLGMTLSDRAKKDKMDKEAGEALTQSRAPQTTETIYGADGKGLAMPDAQSTQPMDFSSGKEQTTGYTPEQARGLNRQAAKDVYGQYGEEGQKAIARMGAEDAASEGLVAAKRTNEQGRKADALEKARAEGYKSTEYARIEKENADAAKKWDALSVDEKAKTPAPSAKQYTHAQSLYDEAKMLSVDSAHGVPNFEKIAGVAAKLDAAKKEGAVKALELLHSGAPAEAIAAEYNKAGADRVDPSMITITPYTTKDSRGKPVQSFMATIKNPAGGPDTTLKAYSDLKALYATDKMLAQQKADADTLRAEASMVAASRPLGGGRGASIADKLATPVGYESETNRPLFKTIDGGLVTREKATDADGNVYIDEQPHVATATNKWVKAGGEAKISDEEKEWRASVPVRGKGFLDSSKEKDLAKKTAEWLKKGEAQGFKPVVGIETGKVAAPKAAPSGGPVRVKSIEEARALKPGTKFIDPNGVSRVR